MAYADYRHCDICDRKTFYDANLNYEQGKSVLASDFARINGEPAAWGYKLDSLGDWSVICRDCAKKFKTVTVERTQAEIEADEARRK
jgi:hypothetical protein